MKCPYCGKEWISCEWCGKPLEKHEVRGFLSNKREVLVCYDCLVAYESGYDDRGKLGGSDEEWFELQSLATKVNESG